jgi:hypothetical protein
MPLSGPIWTYDWFDPRARQQPTDTTAVNNPVTHVRLTLQAIRIPRFTIRDI